MRALFFICGFLLASLAGPSAARELSALPNPYGQDYIRPADLKRKAMPLLQSAPQASAYLERIEQEEWRNGPYGARLSETLLDAANYFESRGNLEQASKLLQRAVHLIRVNDGLYSDLQTSQLERLMQMQLDQGQPEAADELQTRLYRLKRKAHTDGSPERLAALVHYTDWQRRNWLLAPDQENSDVLSDAWTELNKHMPDDDEPALPDASLMLLVYAQMDLLYTIGVSDFGMDRETELMLGRGFAQDQSHSDVARRQVQYLQTIAYSRGRKVLETLIAQLEDSGNATALAEAQLRLGDWHLWYNRQQRAQETYSKAWQEMGDDAAARQALARPVALPARGELLVSELSPLPEDPLVEILATFNVDRKGRPKDVEARAEGEGNEGLGYRLVRQLRGGRFRPGLQDGVMVVTEGVQRRYYVEF